MIDNMTARRFSEKVQKTYVRHVRTFAAFLSRSPDTAVHIVLFEARCGPNTCAVTNT
jgi:hypothetical protein